MKKYIFLFLLLISSINLCAQEKGLDQRIDDAFQPISDFFSSVIFFEVSGYPFVILLLFGAKRLPELAKGLGQGIKEFKKASSEITEDIENDSNKNKK